MARYAVSGRATIAGTAALPLASLYAASGVTPSVVEVGVFNTTSTALVVALARLTTAGTPGTGLTEVSETDPAHTALATGFAGHTVGPTISGELRRATLGAAVGSGIVWTFVDLEIPTGTANGVGLYIPTGTGQILDYYIAWEE